MFKRKIYDKILSWKKESDGRTALLIEGARRIGKTTIVEEFAKKEYSRYVIIDFSKVSEEFKEIFSDLLDIERFFAKMFLALRQPRLPEGSLIVFDEVQFCPQARQAIKHLVADGRYHYIETGSLVSIKENVKDILIPSEEESIQMCPLDYEEFLWAFGMQEEADRIREQYNANREYSIQEHNIYLRHFREYLALGGMPKVVAEFIRTQDFYVAEKEKKNILRIYESDLKKIDSKYGTICHTVWKQIPTMLSQHCSRFNLSAINQRGDSALFQNTLDKLEESKMIVAVYKTMDPTGGFRLTKETTTFKLYLCDVGLFVSLIYGVNRTDVRGIYQQLILDKLGLNFGVLYETFVAQALVSNGHTPYYYSWIEKKGENSHKRYEIDFLIERNGKVAPIEVKSKNIASTTSLNALIKKTGKTLSDKYIVSPKPYQKKEGHIRLPVYQLFALE